MTFYRQCLILLPVQEAIFDASNKYDKVKVFDFAAGIMLDLSDFLEFLRNVSLMKYQKFPGASPLDPQFFL